MATGEPTTYTTNKGWAPIATDLSAKAQAILASLFTTVKATLFSFAFTNQADAQSFTKAHRGFCTQLGTAATDCRRRLTSQLMRDERHSPDSNIRHVTNAMHRQRLAHLRNERVIAVARVTIQQTCEQIRRQWHVRAATLYVYNRYRARIVEAGGLQRMPISCVLGWAAELRTDFAPLLEAGELEARDLLTPLSQVLLLQTGSNFMTSPLLNGRDVAAAGESSPVFLRHLAFLSAARHAPPTALGGNDYAAAVHRLESLWNFFWFRRFHSEGVPITKNPATLCVLREAWVKDERAGCHQALVQLQQHLRLLGARDDALFVEQLVGAWCVRIDHMLKGLETAHFIHRVFSTFALECHCGEDEYVGCAYAPFGFQCLLTDCSLDRTHTHTHTRPLRCTVEAFNRYPDSPDAASDDKDDAVVPTDKGDDASSDSSDSSLDLC